MVAESVEYLNWTSSCSNMILWHTFPPGSGKTMLAQFAVHDLMKNRRDRHQRQVVHAFCSTLPEVIRASGLESSGPSTDVLRFLIGQLLYHNSDRNLSAWSSLDTSRLQKRDNSATCGPLIGLDSPPEELWSLFRDTLAATSAQETFLILDGIEALPSGSRSEFLGSVRKQWTTL